MGAALVPEDAGDYDRDEQPAKTIHRGEMPRRFANLHVILSDGKNSSACATIVIGRR
jgi:hypothetical protein